MPGFTPLNSGDETNRMNSFLPLSEFLPEKIDAGNSDTKQNFEGESKLSRDLKSISPHRQSEDISNDITSNEDVKAEEPSSDNEIEISLPCKHKPKITLHRLGENSGPVTGVQIVCGCGEVIDLTFQYGEKNDSSPGVHEEDVSLSNADSPVESQATEQTVNEAPQAEKSE